MPEKAEVRAEAARLQAHFQSAGAVPVEADILQPADTLLDLYGEDIRARAFVTTDPLRGERMLRPDFTVPVVQMHMAHGAEPARYTYAGEVFRKQEADATRAVEYMQVGYEVFDRAAPIASDAEVFALIAAALAPLNLRPVTGDIGLLKAAVSGLDTTDRRKAALLRHIWRPARFDALLDRFCGVSPMPPARAAVLAEPDPSAAMARAGDEQGKRSAAEVLARLDALREDAATPPIRAEERALLDRLLDTRGGSVQAFDALQKLAKEMPSIGQAVTRMGERLDALAGRGVDIGALEFEARFGRTLLEYYDGFVFGFSAPASLGLPPVATGGRYDALTRQLGRGREIPAVGGVIRPGLVVELGGAA